MDPEDDIGHIVTEFFRITCPRCSQPSGDALHAAVGCAALSTLHLDNEPEANFVPVTTGSAAEFYIDPILSCIGDVDVMFHLNNMLAIPAGHPPPTQLPEDFHSYVELYEIIDSEWPGFVYLRLYGLLSESTDEDCGKYTTWAWHIDEDLHLLNDVGYNDHEMHGPASTIAREAQPPVPRVAGLVHSADRVHCLRCLDWHPQAADWTMRHRKYDWPDLATVDRVISNGCDIVGVAHHSCKQDEWKGKAQWRLSFSRAEVLLLNTWMPVQQIIYHMLRVFMKIERLTDCVDNSGTKILSNYHIKTLMLWTCELKPNHWWTDSTNYISICTKLLHTLGVWLSEEQCQQYFVTECNLLDQHGNTHIIVDQLMSISEVWLSAWFVENYIKTCAAFATDNNLFVEEMRGVNVQNAVSDVVDWWLEAMPDINCGTFEGILILITKYISSSATLTARSALCWIRQLEKVDERLVLYFIAVAFLRAASENTVGSFPTTDTVTTILLHMYVRNESERLYRQRGSSKHSYETAALLMKLAASKPLGTQQLIQIELAKAYLHRALSCKDSDSDSIYCLANVYLAVLYYTTRQYQTAINHCTLVTRSQDHSKCTSHVVEGELLPKEIDSDIDSALGIVVFYQYVYANATKKQTQERIAHQIFSSEWFAYYFYVRYLFDRKSHPGAVQTDEFHKMHKYLSGVNPPQRLFVTDVLLSQLLMKHLPGNKFVERVEQSTVQGALSVKGLLLQSVVKQLTTFRQIQARDFGSVATIVTTDFEALYAYRCGEYQKCLQLCRQNVDTLLENDGFTVVTTYPEFLQLMDDDIVSLVGLTLTVNPACRDDDEYRKAIRITQLTLSLYLLSQCQLKLCDVEELLHLTLSYVKLAQQKHRGDSSTLDHWTLRLIERKLVSVIRSQCNGVH